MLRLPGQPDFVGASGNVGPVAAISLRREHDKDQVPEDDSHALNLLHMVHIYHEI